MTETKVSNYFKEKNFKKTKPEFRLSDSELKMIMEDDFVLDDENDIELDHEKIEFNSTEKEKNRIPKDGLILTIMKRRLEKIRQ